MYQSLKFTPLPTSEIPGNVSHISAGVRFLIQSQASLCFSSSCTSLCKFKLQDSSQQCALQTDLVVLLLEVQLINSWSNSKPLAVCVLKAREGTPSLYLSHQGIWESSTVTLQNLQEGRISSPFLRWFVATLNQLGLQSQENSCEYIHSLKKKGTLYGWNLELKGAIKYLLGNLTFPKKMKFMSSDGMSEFVWNLSRSLPARTLNSGE